MRARLAITTASLLFMTACAHATAPKAITIAPEDQICTQDSDCTNVLTNCRALACECYGTPINQSHKDKYDTMLHSCQKMARAEHQLFACEIDCTTAPRLKDTCVNGRCQLIEQKTLSR